MFTPDAISPQQRLADAHARSVRQLARAQIPLFGLPTGWRGARSTGDTMFETGVTRDADGVTAEIHETVELLHWDGASALSVTSSSHFGPMDDAALVELLPGGTVESLTVRLDTRPVEFATVRRGDELVGRWAGFDATVTLTAQRWPMAFDLELVRITDLAPYHAGRLAELERRSGYRLT